MNCNPDINRIECWLCRHNPFVQRMPVIYAGGKASPGNPVSNSNDADVYDALAALGEIANWPSIAKVELILGNSSTLHEGENEKDNSETAEKAMENVSVKDDYAEASPNNIDEEDFRACMEFMDGLSRNVPQKEGPDTTPVCEDEEGKKEIIDSIISIVHDGVLLGSDIIQTVSEMCDDLDEYLPSRKDIIKELRTKAEKIHSDIKESVYLVECLRRDTEE